MDGIITLKFWNDGEVVRTFTFALSPVVPRVGEEVLGEKHTYVVTKVVHEYFIPFSHTIHLTLERK